MGIPPDFPLAWPDCSEAEGVFPGQSHPLNSSPDSWKESVGLDLSTSNAPRKVEVQS